jgi:hypothetical protein
MRFSLYKIFCRLLMTMQTKIWILLTWIR